MAMAKTIILGAGVAGLAAARRLVAQGHDVEVVDKARGVGGRLATRRIDDARLDHGAQFFTTRGPAFTEFVAEAVAEGVVAEWCRGFGEPDGYPRYRGSEGMTSLAKWMAQDIDVRLGTEVSRIEARGGTVRFVDGSGAAVTESDRAIVTAPIPQMLHLLDGGDVSLPAAVDEQLRKMSYFATLALLVVVDGAVNVDEPGGAQYDSGPYTFVADNHRKGISPVRALTFHAEHDYSLRRYDDDPDEVRDELLELARPWIGSATVTSAQLKKWRYAGPVVPLPDATVVVEADGARIALAGDAFAGPKVEGAFNSGLAAATALAEGP